MPLSVTSYLDCDECQPLLRALRHPSLPVGGGDTGFPCCRRNSQHCCCRRHGLTVRGRYNMECFIAKSWFWAFFVSKIIPSVTPPPRLALSTRVALLLESLICIATGVAILPHFLPPVPPYRPEVLQALRLVTVVSLGLPVILATPCLGTWVNRRKF